MAENKKSVLLYCDIIHTVEALSDVEAGKLFKHYLRYINDQNPKAPDKLTQVVFEPIKQNLKRDLKKWEGIIEMRSKAGLASAERRKQNQQVSTHVDTSQQSSTNPTVTVNVKDKVTVNIKEEFLNNQLWREQFASSRSLSADVVKQMQKKFVKDCDLKGEPVTNYQQYFINAYNKGMIKMDGIKTMQL